MSDWISVESVADQDVSVKSKKRYMVYHSSYGGYVFRCWMLNGRFGSDSVGSLIECELYRPAGKSEFDRQLSHDEMLSIQKTKAP